MDVNIAAQQEKIGRLDSAGALEWYRGTHVRSSPKGDKGSAAINIDHSAARTGSMQSKLSSLSRRTTSGRTVSMQSSFNRSEASDASTRRGSFFDSTSTNFADVLLREVEQRTEQTKYGHRQLSPRGVGAEGLSATPQNTTWTNESSLDYFDLDECVTESASWENPQDAGWPRPGDDSVPAVDAIDSKIVPDTSSGPRDSKAVTVAEKNLQLVADSGGDMLVCADLGKRRHSLLRPPCTS